jgi:hypothetical protein
VRLGAQATEKSVAQAGLTRLSPLMRILLEAETCTRPGEVGEVLRREGLYTMRIDSALG